MADALKQAIQKAPDRDDGIVLILDTELTVRHINHAGATLLGYTPAEIAGKNWFDHFLPQEEGRRLKVLFEKLLLTDPGRLERFQNAVQQKDGTLCLVRWHNQLVRDRKNNIVGYLALGTWDSEPEEPINLPEREAKEKRKRILSAFLEAQEKERTNIAHQLHENLSQVLTMCKLLLEGELQDQPRPGLEKANRYVQHVIDQLRATTHRLNPTQLAEIGLSAATRELAQETGTLAGIRIKVQVDHEKALAKLPPDIQLSLFRIIQEQLANIVQHARASQALINFFVGSDQVELEICDNGRGFTPARQTLTRGLFLIRSRAENHEGVMHLATAPGEGCILSVCLPLDTL